MPPSPLSSTTCPSPAWLCSQRSMSSATSDSRPTSGVKPVVAATSRRLCAALTPRTRYTGTGAATPLRICGPRACYGKIPLHQSVGGGTDQHRIWRGKPLDASRYVRRVPQC